MGHRWESASGRVSRLALGIGLGLGLAAVGCGAPPEQAEEVVAGQATQAAGEPAGIEGVAGIDGQGIDGGVEGRAVAARGGGFVDVQDSFTDDAGFERWFALRRTLRQDFDYVCGDTFCEGDFTNLEGLDFRCSVSTRTGLLGSCLWTFAGSYATVTPATGSVRPTARFFHCKLPVVGTAAALLDALLVSGGERPIHRPLPGSGRSIYDHLTDCL